MISRIKAWRQRRRDAKIARTREKIRLAKSLLESIRQFKQEHDPRCTGEQEKEEDVQF